MFTKFKIKKLKNELSDYRERLFEVSDKAYLVIRPNNLPQLLKPIRVFNENICAISGKVINSGEYAYPCYPNPVRLSPAGKSRALIDEAQKKWDSIVPDGYAVVRIPTVDQIKSRANVVKSENDRKSIVQKETLKFLK